MSDIRYMFHPQHGHCYINTYDRRAVIVGQDGIPELHVLRAEGFDLVGDVSRLVKMTVEEFDKVAEACDEGCGRRLVRDLGLARTPEFGDDFTLR